MTLTQVFYNSVVAAYSTYNLYYGSAEGATGIYHIMRKIADNERPNVLALEQGGSGNMLLQFNTHGGTDMGDCEIKAEALKVAVGGISGLIGTTPNRFRIWNNETTGVRVISDVVNDKLVWGCLFETTLWWESV